jgi:hypothetical protein
VRKVGTQVRISARLINGADGVQVWADDFREELKDVFELQDRIAGVIAKNLAADLPVLAFQSLRKEAGIPKNPFTGIPTRDGESVFRKPFPAEDVLIVQAAKADPSIFP